VFTMTLSLIGRYARLAATSNNAKVTWGISGRPELFTLAPVPTLAQIDKRVTIRDSAMIQTRATRLYSYQQSPNASACTS